MQVKYMQDHQDQEFLGVISGVTRMGIFVEIMKIRMNENGFRRNDYYTFDEKTIRISWNLLINY
jgi:ribonuclease R